MSDYNPYDPPASLGPTVGHEAETASGKHHTQRMLEYLRGTRPWVLFIAILGYVGAGFAAIGALAIMAAGTMSGSGRAAEKGLMVGMAVMYLIGAVVGVWWATMLIKYSQSIGRALESDRTPDVEDALLKQRTFWKANGIMAIAYIGLVILAVFIITIVAAASGLN